MRLAQAEVFLESRGFSPPLLFISTLALVDEPHVWPRRARGAFVDGFVPHDLSATVTRDAEDGASGRDKARIR